VKQDTEAAETGGEKQAMRKIAAAALAAMLAAGPVCGAARASGEPVGGESAAAALRLLNWFDYIPQALLDRFEAEHGVRVVLETYDSNDALLALLRAAGPGRYDLAVPGGHLIPMLRDEGRLDALAEGALRNAAFIEADALDAPFDPGRRHSIPYQRGYTAFAVNRAVYDGDIDTTAILFDPPAALRGRITMLDSREDVFLLAARHLGLPQCDGRAESLAALEALLSAARPHWASFASEEAEALLKTGAAAASMIWNGDAARARADNADIRFAWPREGFGAWTDNVALLRDAPNRKAAVAFMAAAMSSTTTLTTYSPVSSMLVRVSLRLSCQPAALREEEKTTTGGL